MKNEIYNIDWFSNRGELGNFLFDKSNAIYDFSNKSVAKTLWGSKINMLLTHPRDLEKELEGINCLINRRKFASVTLHNNEEKYYTDGKNIVLSSEPLKKFKENGLDIILGTLVHEASHIRFTNFVIAQDKKLNNKCLHWIWNVLEDEVIEEMLQIEKPGLGNVLCPVKDYLFKSDKSDAITDLEKILYTFFALIRYPQNIKNIDEDWLEENKQLFIDIYKILDNNNVTNISIKENASKENYQAALEIFKLLEDKIENGELEGDLEEQFSDYDGEPSDNIKSDMKSTSVGNSTMEESVGGNKENSYIIAEINKCLGNQTEKRDLEKIFDKKEFKNDSTRGNTPTKFLAKINSSNKDEDEYKRLRSKIIPYIRYVKNIQIKQIEKQMTLVKNEYQRNGTLTSRTLANAFQGDKNVYNRFETKIGNEKYQKFALVLALDESGSMGSKYTRDLVTSLAIIFTEAFKNNPNIELFVYGHSDYILNYINPSSKDYYKLGDRYQGGGQNEVFAYNSIIKDVYSHTNSEILLVNITDSQYLSNYKDIENEMSKWTRKIYQSLIVVNNKLNANDIRINDTIYGKDKWAHISNLNDCSKELKKLVTNINYLANKKKLKR